MAMMGGEDRPESETGEKKGICGMEICVAFSCMHLLPSYLLTIQTVDNTRSTAQIN